ncbi:UNVERIFIED_CONTAM: hypothetical protein K2H54_060053 [Gekko kuhli]
MPGNGAGQGVKPVRVPGGHSSPIELGCDQTASCLAGRSLHGPPPCHGFATRMGKPFTGQLPHCHFSRLDGEPPRGEKPSQAGPHPNLGRGVGHAVVPVAAGTSVASGGGGVGFRRPSLYHPLSLPSQHGAAHLREGGRMPGHDSC